MEEEVLKKELKEARELLKYALPRVSATLSIAIHGHLAGKDIDDLKQELNDKFTGIVRSPK